MTPTDNPKHGPAILGKFVVPPAAAVELLEELTESEADDRHQLELKVERAFFIAGQALAELRERKLYRSTHRSFEQYCRERFSFTHRHVNYLIAGSQVVYNLQTGTNGSQTKNTHLGTSNSQILPTSERQVRPLTTLEPDVQREVWQQAVEEAGGIPSGRIVKGIVERLKVKPLFKATNFCQAGDVFSLTRLEGPERKYNTCWAIAIAVNDFTVVVDIHEGTLAVKPDNLKPIDEPDVRRQLPHILKRIRRLRDCGLLDRCAYTVLDSLGRQTYLSEVEEKVLCCLEAYYGVSNAEN